MDCEHQAFQRFGGTDLSKGNDTFIQGLVNRAVGKKKKKEIERFSNGKRKL